MKNTLNMEGGCLVPWTSCTGNPLLLGIRILFPLWQQHRSTPDLSWVQISSTLSELHPQRVLGQRSQEPSTAADGNGQPHKMKSYHIFKCYACARHCVKHFNNISFRGKGRDAENYKLHIELVDYWMITGIKKRKEIEWVKLDWQTNIPQNSFSCMFHTSLNHKEGSYERFGGHCFHCSYSLLLIIWLTWNSGWAFTCSPWT